MLALPEQQHDVEDTDRDDTPRATASAAGQQSANAEFRWRADDYDMGDVATMQGEHRRAVPMVSASARRYDIATQRKSRSFVPPSRECPRAEHRLPGLCRC